MQNGHKFGASAAVVALVGAILGILGSFLPWAKFSWNIPMLGSGSESLNGMDTSDAKITLGVAIVALIVAIVLLALKSSGAKALGAITAVLGVIVGAVGIIDALDIQNKAGQLKQAAMAEGVGEGAIKISSSFGLWLVVVGGIVLLIGGIMAIATKRGLPSVAAAPDAAAGWSPPAPEAPDAPAAPPAPMPPAAPQPPVGPGGTPEPPVSS